MYNMIWNVQCELGATIGEIVDVKCQDTLRPEVNVLNAHKHFAAGDNASVDRETA